LDSDLRVLVRLSCNRVVNLQRASFRDEEVHPVSAAVYLVGAEGVFVMSIK
jgi:hypothetical protein